MNLQFLTIIVFSILAGVYIITLIERKKNRDREAEILRNVPGTINCRCGLEDIGIRINWRQKDKKEIWVGTVNKTECFEISALKNSDYEINFDMYLFTETLPIYLNRFSYLAAAQTTAQHIVRALNNALKEIG